MPERALPEIVETHGELALRVIQLITLYSRLQDNISWLLNNWLMSLPDIGPIWDLSELDRLRDVDRVERFRQAAQALRSTADLSEVRVVFVRVKTTRDLIAHAPSLAFTLDGGRPVIELGHYYGDKRIRSLPKGEGVVSIALLDRHHREINWLLEQVQWVSDEAGFFGGPNKVSHPKRTPGRLP
jgi:hypothetical protein